MTKARFSPPGRLTSDLNDDDVLLDAWSAEVDALLQGAITPGGQLFNPIRNPRNDLQPRRIPWITMPARLANHRFPRATALEEADRAASSGTGREHQPEYSEWFTHRDEQKRVIAVDVTTEVPEYWKFLGQKNKEKVLELYRDYVSPDVQRGDLFDAQDNFIEHNVYNSEKGAMHMTCGINTLNLAIGVAAGGMVWRRKGNEVVDIQECDLSRAAENADPALQAQANRLAREQRAITFADPAGLYILGIDLDGWKRPDGRPVTETDVVKRTRGTPCVRVRLEGNGFALWESTIDGEPIRWGSQIAERFTVGPILAVGPRENFNPDGIPCGGEQPAMATAAAPGVRFGGRRG